MISKPQFNRIENIDDNIDWRQIDSFIAKHEKDDDILMALCHCFHSRIEYMLGMIVRGSFKKQWKKNQTTLSKDAVKYKYPKKDDDGQ